MSDERPGDGPLGFGDDGEADKPSWLSDPEAAPEQKSSDQQAYQPRGSPVNTAKYTWFVGVAAIILLTVVFINSLGTDGPGSEGIVVGDRIPPFAAPMAIGGEVGDVNVARKRNDGSAGNVPACSIHQRNVLTICDAYAEKPLVLAFFATRGSQCTAELDAIERVSKEFPGIGVAAVAIRGDLSDLRKLVEEHAWTFPVAYDRDGVLANLYGVAVCPQITYVRRGGRAAGTTFGLQDEEALRTKFAALEAGRTVPR